MNMTMESNWSEYAVSYDKLLLNFEPYLKLQELVCSELSGMRRCADIGAGTGNTTLELIKQDSRRTVHAIEPNEEMLSIFRKKLLSAALKNRVKLSKQGATNLEFPDSFFDGIVMANSLYAIDDPLTALKEASRVLRAKGVLALSTPHKDTKVEHLLSAIEREFSKKKILARYEMIIAEVRERHRVMDSIIHRNSLQDIRRYLDEAGFHVQEWLPDQYLGAVVVVKAVNLPK